MTTQIIIGVAIAWSYLFVAALVYRIDRSDRDAAFFATLWPLWLALAIPALIIYGVYCCVWNEKTEVIRRPVFWIVLPIIWPVVLPEIVIEWWRNRKLPRAVVVQKKEQDEND